MYCAVSGTSVPALTLFIFFGVVMAIVELKRRKINTEVEKKMQELGYSALLSRVASARFTTPDRLEELVYPSLSYIDSPALFTDGTKGAERIVKGILGGEHIAILTDYDADGITSHTVIKRSFLECFKHPEGLLYSVIGHRIYDGYGIAANLVERVLALDPRPTLVVTADCGSSDEKNIKVLKDAGIDVVVTDHHALPIEGHPVSAYATINPSRVDCNYPDSMIAGCMVSWLMMSYVRSLLIEANHEPANVPITHLLSFVALGTVADCVSLGESRANRAAVQRGLKFINQLDTPCWVAMLEQLGGMEKYPFTSETLGFQVAPRINARSRLNDPFAALHFLMGINDQVSQNFLEQLEVDNNARKTIQQDMSVAAEALAQPQVDAGASVIIVHLEDGHPGVQGIVASRLVQKYGLPTFILTNGSDDTLLGGSGRAVEGIHLRDALQQVKDKCPELLPKFGGHSGAAGVTVLKEKKELFITLLGEVITEMLAGKTLHPVFLSDGFMGADDLNLDAYYSLQALAPYGRGFDAPQFDGRFTVDTVRLVGADKTHCLMQLSCQGLSIKGIWFNAVEPLSIPPFAPGDDISCVFTMSPNIYRGTTSLQLLISHAQREAFSPTNTME